MYVILKFFYIYQCLSRQVVPRIDRCIYLYCLLLVFYIYSYIIWVCIYVYSCMLILDMYIYIWGYLYICVFVYVCLQTYLYRCQGQLYFGTLTNLSVLGIKASGTGIFRRILQLINSRITLSVSPISVLLLGDNSRWTPVGYQAGFRLLSKYSCSILRGRCRTCYFSRGQGDMPSQEPRQTS